MRVAAFVIGFALVAINASARLGETAEQAEKRYGSPTLLQYGAPSVTTNQITHVVTRHYTKGEIEIYADFFTSKAGTMIIGRIRYAPHAFTFTDEVRKQLMDGNGNGETWEQFHAGMEQTYAGVLECWKTKSAIAEKCALGELVFSLNEYRDFVKAAETEDARKKEEKLKKDQKGF